jgi:rhodanese-related sulfurtransferase
MAERICVDEAWRKVSAGEVLLVCAYEDARCDRLRLEGATTLPQLQARLDTIPKDREIIFYCA